MRFWYVWISSRPKKRTKQGLGVLQILYTEEISLHTFLSKGVGISSPEISQLHFTMLHLMGLMKSYARGQVAL